MPPTLRVEGQPLGSLEYGHADTASLPLHADREHLLTFAWPNPGLVGCRLASPFPSWARGVVAVLRGCILFARHITVGGGSPHAQLRWLSPSRYLSAGLLHAAPRLDRVLGAASA